jgi:hypothetical protein
MRPGPATRHEFFAGFRAPMSKWFSRPESNLDSTKSHFSVQITILLAILYNAESPARTREETGGPIAVAAAGANRCLSAT